MLEAMLRYLKGYVRVRVSGCSVERFFNLCKRHQIYLWNLKPRKYSYEMCIRIREFRKLKPIIRKTKAKVEIIQRFGLPFFLQKYRKRTVFFYGMLGCICCIYIMSHFIWNIHIEGNCSKTDETLLEFLETKDIQHGMRKSEVDCEEIARIIRKEFPDIIWVSVSMEGSRLIIQIKENPDEISDEEASMETTITDLVASETGTIEQMITRIGTPRVACGDQVKKGQILVSGRVELINDNQEIVDYEYQSADADVYVKTCDNYKDQICKYKIQKTYPKPNRTLFYLETPSFILELGVPMKQKQNVEQYTITKKLKLGEHFYFPIRYGKKIYREYESKKEQRTRSEIQQILSEHLQKFCQDLEKKGVEIVGKNVKIYNESQYATAKGTFVLIHKQSKRKKTEIIHPKGDTLDGNTGSSN